MDHNQEDEARQIIEKIYFPEFVDEVVKELKAGQPLQGSRAQKNEV